MYDFISHFKAYIYKGMNVCVHKHGYGYLPTDYVKLCWCVLHVLFLGFKLPNLVIKCEITHVCLSFLFMSKYVYVWVATHFYPAHADVFVCKCEFTFQVNELQNLICLSLSYLTLCLSLSSFSLSPPLSHPLSLAFFFLSLSPISLCVSLSLV